MRIVYKICLFALFQILPCVILTAEDFPELQFLDKRITDCGDIKEGQLINVRFRIKNIGDKRLVIYDFFPTCNCTNVEIGSRVIEPNSENEIRLMIDTTGKSGKQTIVVRVLSNSPDKYHVIRVDMTVISK